jgi:hypothetical protein
LIEKAKKYPAYAPCDPSALTRKAMLSLTLEQVIEIANVFLFVNEHIANRFLSGVALDENKRAIHKSIHDSAVNCALSLEEFHRMDKPGARND